MVGAQSLVGCLQCCGGCCALAQTELNLIFHLDPEKASFNEEREPRCRGL
jgi:hypothetical protein